MTSPHILPTMPGARPGIVGMNPLRLQCADCGTIHEQCARSVALCILTAAQKAAHDLWETAWSGESAAMAADLMQATGIDIDDLWQRGRAAAKVHAAKFVAAQRATLKES